MTPAMPLMARKMFEDRYFVETIMICRSKGLEPDKDNDKRSIGRRVVAEIPGRIVRGSDPKQATEAERETTVTTYEVRLSLSKLAELRRENGGCFEIETTDRLQSKASGAVYEVIDDDAGRSEQMYLSVTTVKVG